MIEDKLWINAGVIGIPANDETPKTWFILLNETTEGKGYSFHKIVYDFVEAHKNMISQHLPSEYADTLISGL